MAKFAAGGGDAGASPIRVFDGTLRSFAGYNMKRAFNLVQADLARTLEPFGLRMMTFTALALIVDNPDMSQSQLAGALAVERSNLVTIVDDLEKHGWITRNPAPNDRRSHALRATPDGECLCEKAVSAVAAHEAKLLGGLQASEAAALISTLRKIEHSATGDA
ncbi:MarR family transcriptional regulator [Oricola sp.]|uniref:MarR family winged helix-turn-helix transcriptional regulator n=1 Tax=Oricola sp. TaxID=1979950 RepID=UPI0025FA181C|nr:MarR family transcriptional regulator [Oricola sp.]MCI5075112.1 MarR family transcriptional regulator [Oricola sp.]